MRTIRYPWEPLEEAAEPTTTMMAINTRYCACGHNPHDRYCPVTHTHVRCTRRSDLRCGCIGVHESWCPAVTGKYEGLVEITDVSQLP